MSYYVVDPTDIDVAPNRPCEMKSISDAVGMENMGVRRYDVRPGADIPLSGLHYHDEQEEVFYVVDGELRVETPDSEYVVERDQFFVAEPEHPHRAYNHAKARENAVIIAMGAPAVSDAHSYDG
ncbi:MAG: cupin domain-containing protein [Natronomonas sp.]